MRIYTPSPSMNHIHEVFIQIWFNLDVLYGGVIPVYCVSNNLK